MAGDAVLTINAGSSSLKLAVFGVGAGDPLARELIEGIRPSAIPQALGRWLEQHLEPSALLGVGHRVVHGGTGFTGPVRIDPEVLAALEALCPLAPLHQPHNLAGIRAVEALLPGLPQVACFDTAFHRSRPAVAEWFALPRRFHREGIRRYGFHGLSYESIARALPEVAPEIADRRVVIAHLGSGASLCALRAGRSLDTTMGLTPLDGLAMATRPGALDPGVLLHLMRAHGMDADALERLLYHQSGLKGVSGISGDMRDLLASADPRAAEAVELFVVRCCRELGALAAMLGGLDGLVFTAGIGERSATIRARIAARSAWLGIELDEAANRAGGPRISSASSRVGVFAIPTDEERVIARHTAGLLSGGPADSAKGVR